MPEPTRHITHSAVREKARGFIKETWQSQANLSIFLGAADNGRFRTSLPWDLEKAMSSGTAISSFRCCWCRESPSPGDGAGCSRWRLYRQRRSCRALDRIPHADPGVASMGWHLVAGRRHRDSPGFAGTGFSHRTGHLVPRPGRHCGLPALRSGLGPRLPHHRALTSRIVQQHRRPSRLVWWTWAYYSYITLSTVGYGDITPVRPIARALSMGEALAGQLYLAVLIARLVAMEVITWQSKNQTS